MADDTRNRILDLIKESPGVHFREISRRLDVPMGVVEYHIHHLVRSDTIVAKKEGRYRRYYAEGKHGSKEKKALAYLRKEVPRNIIIHLMTHPGCRHRDIKEALRLTGSTLTFHLQKLVKDGVVTEKEDTGLKKYFVTDSDLISGSLIKYKGSFMDDLVESFAETWLDM
jgi:predicted transcriptional regulator